MFSPRASIAGGLLAFAATAAEGHPVGPESFGTQDEAITIVSFQDFRPLDDANTWEGVTERSSPHFLYAPINMIPNGAILTNVYFYVRDDDAGEAVLADVCASRLNAATGVLIGTACFDTASTSGFPGEIVLLTAPNTRIQYRGDIGGTATISSYYLRVGADGDTGLRLARLHWRREVSPAPATATFGDVPTDHPFFQFVEALADSGITAGCGSGNYCPDAPLTRGQMAAFLAKALGLHWPWDAP